MTTTITVNQSMIETQSKINELQTDLLAATNKIAKNKIEKEIKVLQALFTPVIATPVADTPVIATPVAAIKFAVSTRKAIASESTINPLYLSIACHPNKDGNLKTEYNINYNDGQYELTEYNLLGNSTRSKFVASFEFSRSQGLIVTSSKITLERVDSILRDIYNTYRSNQFAINADYFFLYLLSVMSIADTDTVSGITSYKAIVPSVYRETLTRFPATFKALADREKLIADRLSAYNL
jgi:hypothetical protein